MKKKKIVKPSEKFQNVFKFDWEPSEDTASHDVNPICSNRMGINPLFGRGYIAGLDMQEQRKRMPSTRCSWTSGGRRSGAWSRRQFRTRATCGSGARGGR